MKEPKLENDSSRFDAAVGHVFTVPKSEVDKRIAEEKAQKAKEKESKGKRKAG